MPLAFVGQEYVWMKLFTSKTYGLTTDDMWAFFAGPAFLPWGRMGNIRGWAGGTMSPEGMLNWINERKNLNIQILKRMRSFGMEAALTGFGGHIPAALVKKLNISNTSYTRTKWVEFPNKYGGVYLLEPTSPLYEQIGSDFIKLQMEIYGTDHIYQTDTYNEMDPKTSDPDYSKPLLVRYTMP